MSAERLGASAQPETPWSWSWSWRGTIKESRWMTAVRQIWGLRTLGRGQQARNGVPEQVNRFFSCSVVKQFKVRPGVGHMHPQR
jgi:hypothetical protein